MSQVLVSPQLQRSYRIVLAIAGALSCAYGFLVLAYVKSCPDIGVHCAFSSIIRTVDPRFFDEADTTSLPAPGDELLQVGDDEVKPGKGRLAQVLVLRSLLDLRTRPVAAHDPMLREDATTHARYVRVRYRAADGEHLVWCRIGTIPW